MTQEITTMTDSMTKNTEKDGETVEHNPLCGCADGGINKCICNKLEGLDEVIATMYDYLP